MALSLTNDSKNSFAISNESKSGTSTTWDDATWTWDEAEGTFENVKIVISKESKNNLSITNESKV